MAYVITEPCVATCDTACARACPVDAIHGPLPVSEIARMPAAVRASQHSRLQLYIDPEICICCAACVPECPVDAIFDEEDLPESQRHYRELNAAFFAHSRK